MARRQRSAAPAVRAAPAEPSRTERIASVLGGRPVLGERIREPKRLMVCIRDGLPYAAAQHLSDRLGLAAGEMTLLAGAPPRTLARRKASGTLSPAESDRVVRVASVLAAAADVLGTDEKAAAWLTRPNRSLGEERPLDLLDTEIGEQQVIDALTRIEHGVVA